MTRTVVKHIRLTMEEADHLEQEAMQSNKSVSAYIRYRIFEEKKPQVPPELMEKLQELIYHNQKIGNNINQIAHICNAKKEVTVFEYEKLLGYQQQLEKRTSELYQVLKRRYI